MDMKKKQRVHMLSGIDIIINNIIIIISESSVIDIKNMAPKSVYTQ